MTKTFQTPGPLLLSVRVPAGSIEVETTDGDQTEVDLEPFGDALRLGEHVTVELDSTTREVIDEARVELLDRPGGGHELVVEIAERRFLVFSTAPRVRVHIRCPHGADLDVKTVAADLRTEGSLGTASVKTVSGEVTLPVLAGDARVKAVSGDIRIMQAEGGVEAQTVSGDVTAHAAGGDVSITTVSGDLRIDEAGRSVTTKSVSGDQFIGAVTAGAMCQSVSGDVYVAIPRGLQVYIDANSRSGDVSSELDPSEGDLAAEGGQVAELRIKTMSGDIRIARA
jgi:Putative adhesin